MKHDAVDRDGVLHRSVASTEERIPRTTCSCRLTFTDDPNDSDFDRHLEEVETRAAPIALSEARSKLADAKERLDTEEPPRA